MLKNLPLLTLTSLLALSAMTAFISPRALGQEGWTSREDIIELTSSLGEALSDLETALGEVKAPVDLADTWKAAFKLNAEFNAEVSNQLPYSKALLQFGELTRQMYQARAMMYENKSVCYLHKIRHRYNKVRLGFRKLERAMNGETN